MTLHLLFGASLEVDHLLRIITIMIIQKKDETKKQQIGS
jgi:hypothetical protein